MCGIVGVVSNAPVNQLIYDALLLLQHRGQDAADICTQQGRKFYMHKDKGMVRDVFRTRNMRALPGHSGLPYPPEHGHAAGQPAEQASLTPPVPRQWIGQTENGDKNLPRQPHPPFSSIFFTTASTTSPTVRTERKSSATRR